jgi:hypothetical protein
VRTLLVGMLASQIDGRPAHLKRVYTALVGLPDADQHRLGIVSAWKSGPHILTYRQVEYTFGRIVAALCKPTPDGAASDILAGIVDDLLEASIAAEHKTGSASLAVDWSDHETFSCPPGRTDERVADPEASWGHRRGNSPGQKHETFYGYYLSAATMVADEHQPAVPELIRRIGLSTCSIDPVPAFVPTLARLAGSGVTLGDILADSGYAHRVAANWALPLRALGARLITDLHPHDRGPHGTYAGATLANGNLYCPATPTSLLQIDPLARAASIEATAAHDTTTAEAARYKLAPITADDADGYHRAACPALAGKVRCPCRPDSMNLPYDRPEITRPPQEAPACCTQKTITVPPTINAKTRQKHDYPGPAWRTSYARRTAVERSYSTLKDPATNDINRGWCRLMGLTPILLFLAATVTVRNQRVADAFDARTADNTRRATKGMPPITRRRRRKTITELAATANAPP